MHITGIAKGGSGSLSEMLCSQLLACKCLVPKWVCEDSVPKAVSPTSAILQQTLPTKKLRWPFKRKFVFHARLWGELEGKKCIATFFFLRKRLHFKAKTHNLSIMKTVALKT